MAANPPRHEPRTTTSVTPNKRQTDLTDRPRQPDRRRNLHRHPTPPEPNAQRKKTLTLRFLQLSHVLFSFLFVVVSIALFVAGPSDERSSDADADADAEAEVVPSDGYGGIACSTMYYAWADLLFLFLYAERTHRHTDTVTRSTSAERYPFVLVWFDCRSGAVQRWERGRDIIGGNGMESRFSLDLSVRFGLCRGQSVARQGGKADR
jgi:hypothetical protein